MKKILISGSSGFVGSRVLHQWQGRAELFTFPRGSLAAADESDIRRFVETVQPDVILMDEPTSALDPISTSKIEDLVLELKKDYTIIMVTHNMQQATRVSDRTVFFLLGEVIEDGKTEELFSMPRDKRTEDYITGRFG